MLDVVSDVEVDGDVGADAGGPVLPDVGLGHLHDGEGGDVLSHPGPSPEHRAPVLRLPVRGRAAQTGIVRRLGLAPLPPACFFCWILLLLHCTK